MHGLFQLNVKDVHLRYEDETCIPGRSFASGVIIKSLSAQSTSEDGVSTNKFISLVYNLLLNIVVNNIAKRDFVKLQRIQNCITRVLLRVPRF